MAGQQVTGALSPCTCAPKSAHSIDLTLVRVPLPWCLSPDAVGFFRQVAEINPSHGPTQQFLARLDEEGVDVDAWQAGKDVGGGAEEGEEATLPEAPDLPDEMGSFKL